MLRALTVIALLLATSGCGLIFGDSAPEPRRKPRFDSATEADLSDDPVVAELSKPATPPESALAAESGESSAAAESQTAREYIEGIEVTWLPAPEKVEGYILHYGAEKDALDKRIKLQVGQIESSVDEEGKPFLRYIISPSDPTQSIFVAISSFRGDQESPLSEITEIPPQTAVHGG